MLLSLYEPTPPASPVATAEGCTPRSSSAGTKFPRQRRQHIRRDSPTKSAVRGRRKLDGTFANWKRL